MTTLYAVLPLLMAALFAGLATPWTITLARRVGAMDQPGFRKVHREPVPRLGGLAVVGAVLIGWGVMYWTGYGRPFIMPPRLVVGICLGLLPVALLSYADDTRSVSPWRKLLAHVVGACIAVAFGVRLDPQIHLFAVMVPLGAAAIPISIAWIVGVTSAFNLADGLDGLSAGMGLIAAMSLAAIAGFDSGLDAVVAISVVVGALIGFLPYNLYPARVFMGDVGATSIGFLLACLAFSGGSTRLPSGLAVLVPVLAMGVPIAETFISILRRALRGLGRRTESEQNADNGPGTRSVATEPTRNIIGSVFEADSQHFHHRLLAMGLNQRRAAVVLWLASIGAASVGVASLFMTTRHAALMLVALLCAAFVGVQRLGYDEFAVIRRGMLLRYYDSPVLRPAMFRVFADVVTVLVSIYIAVGLKYERWALMPPDPLVPELFPELALSIVVTFSVLRVYRRSWRAASVGDLVRVSSASLVASAVGFLLLAFTSIDGITFGIFGTYSIVSLVVVTGLRSSFRILEHLKNGAIKGGDSVLLYGAGGTGQLALGELLSNRSRGLRPTCFIDDDPSKVGHLVQGLPILGPVEDLEAIIRDHAICYVVLTSDLIQPQRLAAAKLVCNRLGVPVLRFAVSYQSAAGPWSHPDPRPATRGEARRVGSSPADLGPGAYGP